MILHIDGQLSGGVPQPTNIPTSSIDRKWTFVMRHERLQGYVNNAF